MANSRPPVLGQFEDIGEQIGKNVAKLPTDVLGKALESVGINTGSGQQKQGTGSNLQQSLQQEGSSWQQMDTTKDTNIKKTIARNALEELIKKMPQEELSHYEKNKQEEEQKKKMKADQAKADQFNSLPQGKAKRARGDLYGMKAKKGGGGNEINKNVKAE